MPILLAGSEITAGILTSTPAMRVSKLQTLQIPLEEVGRPSKKEQKKKGRKDSSGPNFCAECFFLKHLRMKVYV